MTLDIFPELQPYPRVMCEDFEYVAAPGARSASVCSTTTDLRTRHTEVRWFPDEAGNPVPLTADDLCVSYHVPAELSCRLALGWPLPVNVLDLCVEYNLMANGRSRSEGRGLLDALVAHGFDAAPHADKPEMQELGKRGPPYSEEERAALVAYNARDVAALGKLLPAMLPKINLQQALLRGRYMIEVAKIEHNGTPVNVEDVHVLAEHWGMLKEALIRDEDPDGEVWEGTTFKEARWEKRVRQRGWFWLRLPSGRLSLSRDTFKKMAAQFPEVGGVGSLRTLLSQLRHFNLPVGADGRTRCGSNTFCTITGRNAPSARQCIFLWPKWCRGLIQAPPRRALVHLDCAQEEYLIAGVLSRDPVMLEDYRRGDVYVSLGQTLGLIPAGGTKETHDRERNVCKGIVLACNYGMGPAGLARKINKPVTVAADLLRRHRETYRRFWEWSDATVEYARVHRRLWTKYGWSCWFGPQTRENTLRNWRVQATGGDVLRVAVCALGAAGFQIDGTVHDSVLLQVDAGEAEGAAREAKRIMVAASEAVLGERLRIDRRVVGPGERLLEAGKPTETWERLWRLLGGLPNEQLVAQKARV
jgi:hypothetical protein